MISVRRVLLTPPRDSNLLLRLQCSNYSTRRSKPQSQWPKPTEVPFQPKLANAVNLIGRVQSPVQFQTSPDGNPWAATVITRQEPSSLWIPVVFEGDLAHTAFSHLKENDVVHISGSLSTDPPHSQQLQSHFQVMAQSLNFVKGYPELKNESVISKEKVFASSENEEDDIKSSKKNIHSKQSEEPEIDKSWKDLLNNPNEWWDVRSTKENPNGAAFERKTDGELLFIDSTTPKWLQEKLESATFKFKPEQSITTSAKKGPESILSSWKDLLHDPKQWWDFRDSKQNGLVNPRHPDFKRKDGSVPLWLNTAPMWLLPKLKELVFDIPVKSKEAKDKGEQSWNDLVQNPAKWWDNRLDKKNERAPDFKHKETGEALWLRGSPSWVLAKLPPVKPKQSAVTSRQQIPVS